MSNSEENKEGTKANIPNAKDDVVKPHQGRGSPRDRRPQKKTQGQRIQEALGLSPSMIQEIEKKLFIARFFDFFSEETLDFAYKDNSIQQYQRDITSFFNPPSGQLSEEDKLLKKGLESKRIFETLDNLKKKAEAVALKNGIKEPVDKRLRKISLIVTLPLFVVLIVFMFLPQELMIFSFPLLCVFCMAPQFLRAAIIKKWFGFKEQNKTEFYKENREDVMVVKNYTAEVLDNIRTRLLDLRVPLQVIKFVLHSRDYDNLKLLNQKVIRGSNQYYFTFKYPPGVKPFPLPEMLRQDQDPMFQEASIPAENPEKNFIVLSNIKAKDGIITEFVPTLKAALADKINDVLDECKFNKASIDFLDIIPAYSEDLGIYCLCGDLSTIINTQVCNWKSKLTFYLFESSGCKCGEKIYILSLLDDTAVIPEELKDIFN